MISLGRPHIIITAFVALSLSCSTMGLCQTAAQQSTERCERVARISLPAPKTAVAKLVSAGEFSGPPARYSGADMTPFDKILPAFCRVVAQATPSADSNIKIEVWMTAAGWNGKLQGKRQRRICRTD